LRSPNEKKDAGSPSNVTGADPLQLAVFVDGENIPYVCWDQIDSITALFGECATKRLYANVQYDSVSPWLNNGREHGFEIIESPPNAEKKNASDYSMISDAKALLSSQEFHGFLIVSTDKYFIPLAKWGIDNGKFVIGMGKSETSITFRNEFSLSVVIDDIPPIMLGLKEERNDVPILIKAFSTDSYF